MTDEQAPAVAATPQDDKRICVCDHGRGAHGLLGMWPCGERGCGCIGFAPRSEMKAVAEPLVCEKCDEEITGTPVYVKGTEGVFHLNCSLRSE